MTVTRRPWDEPEQFTGDPSNSRISAATARAGQQPANPIGWTQVLTKGDLSVFDRADGGTQSWTKLLPFLGSSRRNRISEWKLCWCLCNCWLTQFRSGILEDRLELSEGQETASSIGTNPISQEAQCLSHDTGFLPDSRELSHLCGPLRLEEGVVGKGDIRIATTDVGILPFSAVGIILLLKKLMLEERKAMLIVYGSTSDSHVVGTVLGWC